MRVEFPAGGHIAGEHIALERMKRHGINGAFHQNQPPVGRFGLAVPKPLDPAGGKAGEALVLDLEAAKPFLVVMGKKGIVGVVSENGK